METHNISLAAVHVAESTRPDVEADEIACGIYLGHVPVGRHFVSFGAHAAVAVAVRFATQHLGPTCGRAACACRQVTQAFPRRVIEPIVQARERHILASAGAVNRAIVVYGQAHRRRRVG